MHTAILYIQVPSIRIRFCLKIFLHLVKTVTWMRLFKNATHSGDFLKRWLLVYVFGTNENRDCWIRWCHTSYIPLALRFVCELCCPISIVLAFAWGPAKTTVIRYVRTRILKNIRIRVDVRGLNIYLPPINCSQVFLTVEYTAVVGAEILKEKEAT